MEEKKKKSTKKWWIIGATALGIVVLVAGTYYLIKKKYQSLDEVKDIGNLLNSDDAIKLEPGKKVFVPGKGFVNFIETSMSEDGRRKVKGVMVFKEAFKKGINTENLISATGKETFNLRENQELLYRVEQPLSMVQAVFGNFKAKVVTGTIKLIGGY